MTDATKNNEYCALNPSDAVKRVPESGHRDWYLNHLDGHLQIILSYIDHHPYSPTYGCGDAVFWADHTTSHAEVSHEQYCLPLAMAYKYPLPNNSFYQDDRIFQLCLGMMSWAVNHTEPTGSTSDKGKTDSVEYAHLISTYALTESAIELAYDNEVFTSCFEARARWAMAHQIESVRAKVCAALMMYNIFLLTNDDAYEKACHRLAQDLIDAQSPSGYWGEDDHCRLMEHLQITSLVSRLYQKTKIEVLLKSLNKATSFASLFVRADGTVAGHLPIHRDHQWVSHHGLEVMCHHKETLRPVLSRMRLRLSDEFEQFTATTRARVIVDRMLAWRDHLDHGHAYEADLLEEMTATVEVPGGCVYRSAGVHLFVSTAAGGTVALHATPGACYTSQGWVGQLSEGFINSCVTDTLDVMQRPDETVIRMVGHLIRGDGAISQGFLHGLERKISKVRSVRAVINKVLPHTPQTIAGEFECAITCRPHQVTIDDVVRVYEHTVSELDNVTLMSASALVAGVQQEITSAVLTLNDAQMQRLHVDGEIILQKRTIFSAPVVAPATSDRLSDHTDKS